MTAEQTPMAPVLHRRILGEGLRSAGYLGDPAGVTRRLRDARVVVADNVADYFYGPDSPEHWQLALNLPTLLPRGAEVGQSWFIEWRIPARSSLTAYSATMVLTGPVPWHGCWLDVRSGPALRRRRGVAVERLEVRPVDRVAVGGIPGADVELPRDDEPAPGERGEGALDRARRPEREVALAPPVERRAHPTTVPGDAGLTLVLEIVADLLQDDRLIQPDQLDEARQEEEATAADEEAARRQGWQR